MWDDELFPDYGLIFVHLLDIYILDNVNDILSKY